MGYFGHMFMTVRLLFVSVMCERLFGNHNWRDKPGCAQKSYGKLN